jgi:hypothetical protein
LKRDSDGDKLTDIAEYKLLLDARNPDTDGDALEDGYDPLPNVPFKEDAGDRSALMAAVLKATIGYERAAIVTGIGGGAGSIQKLLKHDFVTLGYQRTTFILGERGNFSGLYPSTRLMVFNETEYDRMKESMGIVYPVRFKPVFVNKQGDMAFVQWSAGWTGGTLLLRKKNGEWIAESVSNWIT